MSITVFEEIISNYGEIREVSPGSLNDATIPISTCYCVHLNQIIPSEDPEDYKMEIYYTENGEFIIEKVEYPLPYYTSKQFFFIEDRFRDTPIQIQLKNNSSYLALIFMARTKEFNEFLNILDLAKNTLTEFLLKYGNFGSRKLQKESLGRFL